ncbi:hypothetical protein TEA_018023 [Camellia sinensis var. sinensis]|uniref:Alpha-1,4 glucan phosphorylase n=1 Tax=Camellia sinensis var. sinensis TaxID=542762 RepID=A0A4S4EB45_CAMSN|nr:hypothetical protein TEA_018023 [Camellia sinensis var. sinensis]
MAEAAALSILTLATLVAARTAALLVLAWPGLAAAGAAATGSAALAVVAGSGLCFSLTYPYGLYMGYVNYHVDILLMLLQPGCCCRIVPANLVAYPGKQHSSASRWTTILPEKDAALGNGGLGRLASCFLDSMATLNLPAWGRKWVGGEVVQALAYDVPIPGYKTKNIINLHLWEAKAGAENFNLFQFNDGQKWKAFAIEETIFPVQCIRFKERKDGKSSWQWSECPNKVAVQLNDTHPTLAIPELMRLLMDDDGLGWDEAWDVTTRTIAYTNHTVLPEALEKCSQAVMWKLLPHHMEIIEEIDKRFIAMIRSTKPELESKLSSMRIMDNNPQKPVVRMANLCVVSSHTVNGVAQLHSDILKSELFADYVSIWPKKFQNKTNDFQAEWESAKMADKQRLAQFIFQVTGVSIDPNSLFDLQFKRIHEYKRQLLNILGVVYSAFDLHNAKLMMHAIIGSEMALHVSSSNKACYIGGVEDALKNRDGEGLGGLNIVEQDEYEKEEFFSRGATISPEETEVIEEEIAEEDKEEDNLISNLNLNVKSME